MEQPQTGEVSVYADIGEVRLETRVANCKKLLAEGWVLLGVYPLTTVGEMAAGQSEEGQQPKRIEDT